MASYGLPAQAKATPRQDPLLFLGGPRPVGQAFAANRHPKATSMAFYGRPSLPFASPKTLQTPKTPKRPLQWLLMGFQRRQKLPQGQIHCCFWAVQRAVRQAFAANGHPKATSMASYGLPAQAKATPRQDPLLFLGGPRVPLARHSQRTGIPRPHPWLFMGVQACRLPALKRSKPLKPLKGHFNGFLWASSAGKSYPKARSIAVSGRSSVPFARHSQPTGIPRPHPWLFLGVQACRLPALKRSKRLSQIAGCVPKDWGEPCS